MTDDERVREEWVKRFRENLHATYNGGHHEEPAHDAFHHGMDTVCNVLAASTGWEPIAAGRESVAERENLYKAAHNELHRYQVEIGETGCEFCEALERVGELGKERT